MSWIRTLAALLLMAAVACGGTTSEPGSGRPVVVASFYPLAFVVEEVGGSLVDLENLTPAGAEPHDLELTPSQVRGLAGADLIVYLGGGFQPAVEDALKEIDAREIDVLRSQGELLEPTEHHDEGEEHEEDDHEEGAGDPHVWLDPARLSLIADAVADQLAALDPDNARRFRDNATDLRSRLSALDAEFRSGLARCDRSTIVTSHQAFGYLAEAYGLEELGIAGIDSHAEPSPRRLAEVAEFARENGVTTIFFEVLVSPQTAETLAAEVGVETARLDPLEGPPETGDYFTAMQENLDALRSGLGCS